MLEMPWLAQIIYEVDKLRQARSQRFTPLPVLLLFFMFTNCFFGENSLQPGTAVRCHEN
jgi:hypothetical protein